MNRTKSLSKGEDSPHRGQLGRFRKVSKQAPQVPDFFGVEEPSKDVHGIPGWENPMEAGSSCVTGGFDKMSVSPRKPKRAPTSRKVDRHA